MVKAAFTLIELIVVIAIIAVLATLILVSIPLLFEQSKQAQTDTIMGGIRLGLGEADAEGGSSLAPVEHPLAGSNALADFPSTGVTANRPRFVRDDGTLCPVTGEALVIDDPSRMSSDQNRVITDDDHYDGYRNSGDLPLLYGVERKRIGVLGATTDWIAGYRRLPPEGAGYDDGTGKLATPYDKTVYKDALFLYRAPLKPRTLYDDATTAAVKVALGTKLSHLQSLGAIFTAAAPKDPDVAGNWIAGNRDVQEPESGTWDSYHRIWFPPAVGEDLVPAGKHTAGTIDDGGTWKRYRLRGMALYDAWGSEIIYYLDSDNRVNLVSAGKDGVLKWHPGEDRNYQTAAEDDSPSGDDIDGSRDNLALFIDKD